jgi:hypothetical protein
MLSKLHDHIYSVVLFCSNFRLSLPHRFARECILKKVRWLLGHCSWHCHPGSGSSGRRLSLSRSAPSTPLPKWLRACPLQLARLPKLSVVVCASRHPSSWLSLSGLPSTGHFFWSLASCLASSWQGAAALVTDALRNSALKTGPSRLRRASQASKVSTEFSSYYYYG